MRTAVTVITAAALLTSSTTLMVGSVAGMKVVADEGASSTTATRAKAESSSSSSSSLPEGFVYLADVDPTIVQAVRYSGPENALGNPLDGYKRNTVVMTAVCAEKLKRIQRKLKFGFGGELQSSTSSSSSTAASSSSTSFGLSLAVYDAYRPRKAVEDFWQWAHLPPNNNSSDGYNPDAMGPKYFPKFCCQTAENGQTRATLFQKGYISMRSNHARGSTIDITIVADTPEAREAVRRGSEGLLPLQNRELMVVDPPTFMPPPLLTSSSSSADGSTMIEEDGALFLSPRLLIPTADHTEAFEYDHKIREYLWPRLNATQRAFIDSLDFTRRRHLYFLRRAREKEAKKRGNDGSSASASSPQHDSAATYVTASFPFLNDGSVDMGTSFDLFDMASHPIWPGYFYIPNHNNTTTAARRNTMQKKAKKGRSAAPTVIADPIYILRRMFLQCIFEEEGFEIAEEEWWHFWLAEGEPFPFRPSDPQWGFNFDVV